MFSSSLKHVGRQFQLTMTILYSLDPKSDSHIDENSCPIAGEAEQLMERCLSHESLGASGRKARLAGLPRQSSDRQILKA